MCSWEIGLGGWLDEPSAQTPLVQGGGDKIALAAASWWLAEALWGSYQGPGLLCWEQPEMKLWRLMSCGHSHRQTSFLTDSGAEATKAHPELCCGALEFPNQAKGSEQRGQDEERAAPDKGFRGEVHELLRGRTNHANLADRDCLNQCTGPSSAHRKCFQVYSSLAQGTQRVCSCALTFTSKTTAKTLPA